LVKHRGKEKKKTIYRERVSQKQSTTERLTQTSYSVGESSLRHKREGGGRQLNKKLCQHPKLRTTLTAKMCAKSIPNWYMQWLSTNKVHDNYMQNNVSKDEISKTSLWTDTIELVFVLWIHLKPQTHCKEKQMHI